jgi:uncharacterized protein (DUF1330 family)
MAKGYWIARVDVSDVTRLMSALTQALLAVMVHASWCVAVTMSWSRVRGDNATSCWSFPLTRKRWIVIILRNTRMPRP